jgi:hypothetical protein
MPDKSTPATIAYICECARKWALSSEKVKEPAKWKCRCGRLIVVQKGAIYSVEVK